jgi:hypothetical protein
MGETRCCKYSHFPSNQQPSHPFHVYWQSWRKLKPGAGSGLGGVSCSPIF